MADKNQVGSLDDRTKWYQKIIEQLNNESDEYCAIEFGDKNFGRVAIDYFTADLAGKETYTVVLREVVTKVPLRAVPGAKDVGRILAVLIFHRKESVENLIDGLTDIKEWMTKAGK